jgi:hypothetical protein
MEDKHWKAEKNLFTILGFFDSSLAFLILLAPKLYNCKKGCFYYDLGIWEMKYVDFISILNFWFYFD